MLTILLMGLAGYFGFLIGRRYTEGVEEEAQELAAEAVTGRRGVRLRTIAIRR